MTTTIADTKPITGRAQPAPVLPHGEPATAISVSHGKGKKGDPSDPVQYDSVMAFALDIEKRSTVARLPVDIDGDEYKRKKDRNGWVMRAIDEAKAYDDEKKQWHRRKGSVTSCDFLLFDADKMRWGAYARVRKYLKESGVAFLMYQTTGHGLDIKGGVEQGECFRVFIPCQNIPDEIAVAVNAWIREQFAELFPGDWDETADQPTRVMYLPPKGARVDCSEGNAPALDALHLFTREGLTLVKANASGIERGEADVGAYGDFIDHLITQYGGELVQKPDGRVGVQMSSPRTVPNYSTERAPDKWAFWLPSGGYDMMTFTTMHGNGDADLGHDTKPGQYDIMKAVNAVAKECNDTAIAGLYADAVTATLTGVVPEPVKKQIPEWLAEAREHSEPEDAEEEVAPTGVDWGGKHFGLITGSSARALMPDDFEALNKISKNYSLVTVGGKVLVAFSQKGDFGDQVEFLRPLDFKARMGGCGTIYGWKKVKGKPVAASPIDVATAWLNWSLLRRYNDGVTFAPGEGDQGSRLNLWQGYAVEAKRGDVSVWLEHLERVICNGDTANARYLLQYLAHMVQRPQEKPSVSVTLRTEGKGAGKDLFLKPLLTMFGRHAILLNDTNQVTGRFNAVLEGKILITLNEARIHSEDQLQKFKTVVSEPTAPIERKGVDIMNVRNFARLISTTNHDDAIKVEKGERRQFMLACSEEYAHREGDAVQEAKRKGYFDPLVNFMKNDGPAYLLDYLQSVDLSGFDPYTCPATAELSHALALNMAPFDAWLIEVAQNPRIMKDDGFTDAVSAPNDKGEVKFLVDSLSRHYIKRFQPFERKPITLKSAQTKIGLVLTKARIAAHRDSLTGGGKSARYFWINPDRFREKIAAYLGQTVESLFE
ncbi:primase-helicase family protein [Leclercia tamurae]|uniref:primase-helicase family protein n=1 Tax=Leclercia tamurae TaxID=2926467 RepID=UPI0036F47A60